VPNHLQDEVLQMEAELQELQSNCVVTANELLGATLGGELIQNGWNLGIVPSP
jgi:hypothetical protein